MYNPLQIGINSLEVDTGPPACKVEPSFSNVALLMHCEGAHGGTVFTDSSSYAHSIVRQAGGTIVTSTAESKFGSSSLAFPDHTNLNNFLRVAHHNILNLGSDNPFCIEFFVKYLNPLGCPTLFNADMYFFHKANAWVIGMSTEFGENNFVMADVTTGTNNQLVTHNPIALGGIPPGHNHCEYLNPPDPNVSTDWRHMAFTYDGTTYRIFMEGVQLLARVDTPWIPSSTQELFIGAGTRAWRDYPDQSHSGWLDEIRIVNGEAVYTCTFTPPTAPHPDA